MTYAERRLCDWQYGRSSSFFTALFELMARADSDNLVKLAAGFPFEARAFRLYSNDEFYWPRLEKEYTGVKDEA